MQIHSYTRYLRTAVLVVAATSGFAFAASPDAWSEHDKEVAATCAKTSGLAGAQAIGKPMVYDDRVGITALLIQGRYPQAHMKNRIGQELCLFDRQTREAVVTEADQLGLRAATPVAKPASVKK